MTGKEKISKGERTLDPWVLGCHADCVGEDWQRRERQCWVPGPQNLCFICLKFYNFFFPFPHIVILNLKCMWEGANAKHCCMVSSMSQPCFTRISHVVIYLNAYVILYTAFTFDLGFCTFVPFVCAIFSIGQSVSSRLMSWWVCILGKEQEEEGNQVGL